ncbi:uncharacterized protein LOC124914643 [Impatiens glandulifera]|uniref:uncharacterized protein LOC124914643 n=1 Tax=Impatiens glandulifera TaxID=253017 RepID=UPI001FB194C4|nr:uncharacterized protein LOC124914643 [Impatiens glandulifera]
MMDNLNLIAKAVSRFAVKCDESNLRRFEIAFGELVKSGSRDLFGWQLSYREMEKNVKKIERFVDVNSSLHRELELISEIEYSLKRTKNSDFEKKLAWKKREVKQLKDISFWNKSYDYVLILLARSIFTVFRRIGFVFGMNHDIIKDSGSILDFDIIDRSHSISASSIHPSETAGAGVPRFSSGPLDKWVGKRTNFYSGPLVRSDKTGSRKEKTPVFLSGPLEKSTLGSVISTSKSGFKLWPFKGKKKSSKSKQNLRVNGDDIQRINQMSNQSIVSNATPPPGSLGAAALGWHYANIIIAIERLAISPYLIGQDARDDLYSMLPVNVRSTLREKLKPHGNKLVCDTGLGQDWSEYIAEMLEWLGPLAHNMIRWQSERSLDPGSSNGVWQRNVFLVQTLHFADQEKTEDTIVELLMGLNYIWRLGRELSTNG